MMAKVDARWRHSVYRVHQQAPAAKSGKNAHTNAGENHSEALPKHKPHDIAGASPERYAGRRIPGTRWPVK